MILFSDGMRLMITERGPIKMVGTNQRVLDSLRRLTELCNRSSVVIYTIDPRGVASLGFTAADQLSSSPSGQGSDRLSEPAETVDQLDREPVVGQVSAALSKRSQDFSNTQEGLNFMAHETGGLFVHNTNDISAALNQVLEDQSGYYLIGYTPDAALRRGRIRIHNRVDRRREVESLRVISPARTAARRSPARFSPSYSPDSIFHANTASRP